jgi:hypothetical protein
MNDKLLLLREKREPGLRSILPSLSFLKVLLFSNYNKQTGNSKIN